MTPEEERRQLIEHMRAKVDRLRHLYYATDGIDWDILNAMHSARALLLDLVNHTKDNEG